MRKTAPVSQLTQYRASSVLIRPWELIMSKPLVAAFQMAESFAVLQMSLFALEFEIFLIEKQAK